MDYPAPVSRLIDELRKLPGSARSRPSGSPSTSCGAPGRTPSGSRRRWPPARRHPLLLGLQRGDRPRGVCPPARTLPEREDDTVVEEPDDVASRGPVTSAAATTCWGGRSPLDGVGPDELRIAGLVDRVRAEGRGGDPSQRTPPSRARRPLVPDLARLLKPSASASPASPWAFPWVATWSGPNEVPMSKALEGRSGVLTRPSPPGDPLTPGPRLNSVDLRATLVRSQGTSPPDSGGPVAPALVRRRITAWRRPTS